MRRPGGSGAETMKECVVVAMSGGVDSSVAAALLARRGFEVIGMTMCFNLPDAASDRTACCGPTAIADAKRVAGILGIPHYVLSFGDALRRAVIDDFIHQYEAGRTPNPCIRCNQLVKFDALLKMARASGGTFLATGHYARIGPGPILKKAKDKTKDQSYFLYRLNREQLGQTMFPLGERTKTEVRALAHRFGLPVAQKKESQEICFVPEQYTDFLRAHRANCFTPGAIVDTSGKVLGEHPGIGHFTIGQRQGLRIAARHPLYVVAIDSHANTVVVGPREDTLRRNCILEDVVFADPMPCAPFRCRVRIRHRHREQKATVTPDGQTATVLFDQPQSAITPGQSAAFYRRDTVLGGGIIQRTT
jgi:tRNA-specific 2-thiouridylase